MISPLIRDGKPAATGLVLSVPHGGRTVPARFRSGLLRAADDLWADWNTDELYDFSLDLEIPTVIARLSRFVADPNRDPAGERHGSFWSAIVPATDPWDVPLYDRPLDAEELDTRIAAAHQPFHEALDNVLKESLRHHERVLLLDLHSFGLPLGADIVLGDRGGTSATPPVSDRVEEAFRTAGFETKRNTRFAGGWITARHQGNEWVDAVQIELNQRRYLLAADVDNGRTHPKRDEIGWQQTRRSLRAALEQLSRPFD